MGSRNAEARQAGEIIYRSLSLSGADSRGPHTQVPIPWDNQACCGIMSPVRRTFCLFVTFDLILVFVVWVIYTQVLQDSISFKEFIDQVVNYSFRHSLFDTVLCAAWRFAPLQLAYALFRIRNPSVVAITTFGTCVFVITKAFMFKFDPDKTNVVCYLLFIITFIICWIETWFLDFKVVPREKKARDQETHGIYVDERTPLLGHHRNLLNDNQQYYSPHEHTPGDSDGEGSPDGFHSVPGSRSHSRNHSIGSWGTSLGSQEQEYLQKAQEAWDKAWEILHTDDWKKESGTDIETGFVYSKHLSKVGKIFKLEAVIDAPKQEVFEELVIHCDKQPEWNATVLEGRTLQAVNENTDVYYTIAAEAAGGLVSSRDFVNLRHWSTKDGIILSAGCAVMHPDMPPCKKHVRGENRPGGWIFKPIDGEPNKCIFCWIINTDLKGWIPQYAVDQALSGTLLDFTKHVKQRMAVKQANQR